MVHGRRYWPPHGSNDNRVGVTESHRFNNAAVELDGLVTYVEFEGQQPGMTGLVDVVR